MIDFNSFWTTCPRKLKDLPSSTCAQGRCGSCPFAIANSKANYCFWKYVHINANEAGLCPELEPKQIAKLLKIDKEEIEGMILEAELQLKRVLQNSDDIQLMDLLEY